jgi:chromosome partitioning protein
VQTFAIVNQKGGCGKTTTAINLAGVFAGRGYRTLLVDMDPQGHCAAGLAIPENRIDLHIGDAMLAAADAPVDARRLLWRVSRNLDLAPATVRLAALEAPRGELAGKSDAERRLKLALDRFDTQYDICLIDCSPAIGLLAFNALVAADEVLIPVETGFFSLQGATKQVNTIKSIGKRLGVAPTHRVLATMHDPASMLSKDLLEELRRRFTNRLIPVVVRFDQSLKEAASFGQPVVEYASESDGAKDYGALADWLAANSLGREKAATRATIDEEEVGGPGVAGNIEPVETPSEAIATTDPANAGGLPSSRAADVVSRARKLQARASETAAQAAASATSVVELKTADADVLAGAAPAAAPEPVAAPIVEQLAAMARSAPGASPAPTPPPSVAVTSTVPLPPPAAWPSSGFGPQVTPYGVIFRAPASIGRSVAVAGDFNQWSPERTPLRLNEASGALEAVAFMPPGSTSQYRLVIDGNWIADPYNPCLAPNPFGGTNSVISVPFMGLEMPSAPTIVVRTGQAPVDAGRRA